MRPLLMWADGKTKDKQRTNIRCLLIPYMGGRMAILRLLSKLLALIYNTVLLIIQYVGLHSLLLQAVAP
jgi:hypothetical protein